MPRRRSTVQQRQQQPRKTFTEVQQADTRFGPRSVTRHIQNSESSSSRREDLPDDLVQTRQSPFTKDLHVKSDRDKRRIRGGDATGIDFYLDPIEELGSEDQPETIESRMAFEKDVVSPSFKELLAKKGASISNNGSLYIVQDDDKNQMPYDTTPTATSTKGLSKNARRRQQRLSKAIEQLCNDIPRFPVDGIDDPYYYFPPAKRHLLVARSAVRESTLLLRPKKLEFLGKRGQDAVQLTKGDMVRELKCEGLFYRWCKYHNPGGKTPNKIVCQFGTEEPDEDGEDGQLPSSDVLLHIILEKIEEDDDDDNRKQKGKEEEEDTSNNDAVPDRQRVYFITYFFTYVDN